MRRRIVAVDAAAEHGDRDAARLERALVRLAVDAAREAAHDDEPRRRELPTERSRDLRAVAAARAGSDDRDRRPREQRRPSRRRAGTGPAADRGSPRSSGGNADAERPRSGARAPRAQPEACSSNRAANAASPRGRGASDASTAAREVAHRPSSSRGERYDSASATCSGRTASAAASAATVRATRATRARPRPESGSRSTARSSSASASRVRRSGGPPRRSRASTTRARTGADASAGPAASSSARGPRDDDDEVEAVEQRAGELVAERGEALRRARALGRRVAAPAAGHRFIVADELEARRERRPPPDAGDADDAVLERLPQRLERGSLELRQLVEEQHAAVREARLAGPRARARRRRSPPSRRCGAARGTAARRRAGRSAASSPATEWIRVTSSASSSASGGRIPGSRRASIVFPVPGGPAKSRLWPPAAASSSARRARSCPRTSARSGTSGAGAAASLAVRLPRRQLDLARAGTPTASARWRTGTGSIARERDLRRRLRPRRACVRDPSAAPPPPRPARRRPAGCARRARARPGTRAARAGRTTPAREAARIASAIGRSKPDPSFRRLGRREVDRDAPLPGHSTLGRRDPAAHAFLRLLARAVGEPDDRESRNAAADVGLHLDPAGVEADDGVSDRAREHLPDGTAAIRTSSCRVRAGSV